MARTSDIIIDTSTLSNGTHSIDIDFSAIGSIDVNDYFELHIDDSIIKLNVSSNMSIPNFIEWVARNCNADYDLYNKTLATSNSNILTIVTRNTNSIKIDLDYNKE